jgi:hypothetical protein
MHEHSFFQNDVTQERHLLHPNSHLLNLAYNLWSWSFCITTRRYPSCSYSLLELTNIPSMNTTTNLSKYSIKTLSTRSIKVGWGLNQSKIHHRLLVRTIPQNEVSLWNVSFSYPQLILSRSKINLGEHTHTLRSWSNRSSNLGSEYLFSMVTSFKAQ